MLADHIDANSIIPEGKDDLVLANSEGDHLVQVKSKQPDAQPFTPSKIANLLMEGLVRAGEFGASRVTVCLEDPLNEAAMPEHWPTLADLPSADPARVAFEDLARDLEWDHTQMEEARDRCGYVFVGWRRAEDEARLTLTALHGLTVPQVAEPIFNAIRQAIAERTDANAPVGLGQPHRLTRTDLEAVAADVLRTTDPSHLAAALEQGLCSPVLFDSRIDDPTYYEGVSTQPGHVAADLVVQPPGALDDLYQLLIERGTVLLVGPSGVGKSARAWSLARHVSAVRWYRIDRLDPGDANTLVRFVQAFRPSERAPIGLIHDFLGSGSEAEYENLRRQLAGVHNVFLLGTIREEDLATVVSRHEIAVSEVHLDSSAAEAIYTALAARGITQDLPWAAAYEQARGLTLEYTHLLTRGERLGDVIDAQISTRVLDPSRSTELDILALVSQAHVWGASLRTDSLRQYLGVDVATQRRANSRLLGEHLVAEVNDGSLIGLHPLRSKAILQAIHRVPPPTRQETRRAVFAVADDHALGVVALGACLERRGEGEFVRDLAAELRSAGPRRIASALRAVRAADFSIIADEWRRTMVQSGVPPTLMDITTQLQMVGTDVSDLTFHPGIVAALHQLPGRDGQLDTHQALVRQIQAAVIRSVAESTSVSDVTCLLAALGPDPGVSLDMSTYVDQESLVHALRQAAIDEVAECIATASWIDADLAATLVRIAGGASGLLERVQKSDRFIIEAEVVHQEEELVARARVLLVSDQLQPQPDQHIRDLAKLLLKLLPECERADVQAVLVGGVPVVIGELQLYVSGLLRRYAISDAEVTWNRTRSLLVQQSLPLQGESNSRDTVIPGLFEDTVGFMRSFTRVWCTSRNRPDEMDALHQQRSSLSHRIDQFVGPRQGQGDSPSIPEIVTSGEAPASSGPDHVYTLISGIVNHLPERLQDHNQWGSLAAFCEDTLRRALRDSADELARSPIDLGTCKRELDTMLSDLHAVLAELAWGDMDAAWVVELATSGPYPSALARVAKDARSRADSRALGYISSLVSAGRAHGLALSVHQRRLAQPTATQWPPQEVAVGVHVDTIMDWPDSLVLTSELVDDNLPLGHAPALIYPLMDGLALGRISNTRIITTLPDTGLFETWIEDIEAAAPTTVTDLVVLANQSLAEIANLMELGRLRPDLNLQEDLDMVAQHFDEALDALADQVDDSGVIEELIAVLGARSEVVGTQRASNNQGDAPADRLSAQLAEASVTVAILFDVAPGRARAILNVVDD